ncbi:hypothetical protein E1265_19415 [Streptomyces sp. 8K308]|uniref:hypothetical protein n=1 Tax=Streptomyces sp. 8K308 TaxID=2530388 RepID=UPI001049891D|nr:hypothetical protein [Streptomyces sp. 8K308]TDC20968.1 hypothetical protein E1265_19415 [Streptomyces sp. 8K308]
MDRIRLGALASDAVEWRAQYAVIRTARLVEVEAVLQARAGPEMAERPTPPAPVGDVDAPPRTDDCAK